MDGKEGSKKLKIILIVLALILIFTLVYSPHFSDPFPKHMDEWNHLTKATELARGEYNWKSLSGLEIGFHAFLAILYILFGSSLIWIYQFLPAIFACITSLVLFMWIYKKIDNKNGFLIALMTMFFFASIKSNVNINGLWFFTPLSFAFPFIFLYMFLFTQGIEKENKKSILASLTIMIFLLFTHAISVIFAIPILIVYSLFHLDYLKKEWKFFSLFLLVPLAGLLFYKIMRGLEFGVLFSTLFNALQFKKGWSTVELDLPFTLLYSLIGYIFTFIGAGFILFNKEKRKKYLIFILWPIILLISIIIFTLTDISYFVPYQRNLYYFVIILPVLSAFGLYFTIKTGYNFLKKIIANKKLMKIIGIIVLLLLIISIFYFAFKDYQKVPSQIKLYTVITPQDYYALRFLYGLEKSTIMADPLVASAMYPISYQRPVGTIYFYGHQKSAESFFLTKDCQKKGQILEEENASYVLSRSKINCNWTLVYDNAEYVYKVN